MPEPTWPEYKFASNDHLVAIGAFVAAWNEIENAYQVFIQTCNPHNIKFAVRTHDLLGNESRAELIRDCIGAFVQPDEHEEVLYFLKCASICRENRNVIVHGHYSPSSSPETHVFVATGMDKTKTFVRTHFISLEGLREMADAARATAGFGFNVWSTILSRRTHASQTTAESLRALLATRLALPSRFPQPRKWHQIREDQPSVPPQPGSSGA